MHSVALEKAVLMICLYLDFDKTTNFLAIVFDITIYYTLCSLSC